MKYGQAQDSQSEYWSTVISSGPSGFKGRNFLLNRKREFSGVIGYMNLAG